MPSIAPLISVLSSTGFDVIRLHPLVDAHELLELLVIGRVRGSEGAGGHGNQGERSDERERRKKLGC